MESHQLPANINTGILLDTYINIQQNIVRELIHLAIKDSLVSFFSKEVYITSIDFVSLDDLLVEFN